MRIPPHDKRRSRAGYTLLEMLVVLAIIAVAAGALTLAWPSRPSDDKAVSVAADSLARHLGKLRAEAVAQNRLTQFELTRGGAAVAVPGPDRTAVSILAGGRKQDQGMIDFNADGSSRGGELLVERGTKRRIVRVSWPLGRITVLTPES